MKNIGTILLVSLVLFVTTATVSYARYVVPPTHSALAQTETPLPDFTKPPYFTFFDPSVLPSFSSRVHPEWAPVKWVIFITNETKRNFIAVYYDNDAMIRYAEWATDTDAGAVIRGYWYVGNTFVFDKEILHKEILRP